MTVDRSIADLLGEALYRHRHGLIRPLWRDMAEEYRALWRLAGRNLLTAADGLINARAEVECLTAERDQAQGLLREAAAKTLSVRSALTIIREHWRASADYAAAYATDDPQTPEQWRAFGGVENLRACADELDPNKDSIFEPSELAKAQAEVLRVQQTMSELKALLKSAIEILPVVLEEREATIFGSDDVLADLIERIRAALFRLDAPEPRS